MAKLIIGAPKESIKPREEVFRMWLTSSEARNTITRGGRGIPELLLVPEGEGPTHKNIIAQANPTEKVLIVYREDLQNFGWSLKIVDNL